MVPPPSTSMAAKTSLIDSSSSASRQASRNSPKSSVPAQPKRCHAGGVDRVASSLWCRTVAVHVDRGEEVVDLRPAHGSLSARRHPSCSVRVLRHLFGGGGPDSSSSSGSQQMQWWVGSAAVTARTEQQPRQPVGRAEEEPEARQTEQREQQLQPGGTARWRWAGAATSEFW